MRTPLTALVSAAILSVATLAAATLAAAPAAAGAELVVVNPDCNAAMISAGELKALYGGRKRSLPDGERMEILVLADSPIHERFLADYLGSTPDQFSTYWERLVFIGQGKLPRSFASEKELLAYVAATPGAIGYIDAGTPHDGVKVLTISQ
jgi:hypothetical protein